MYHIWKNFRNIKSFVQSKNFQIAMRKRLCRLKTFAKQKVSQIKKTFARKSDMGVKPMPAAKKVDPLPHRGVREYKLRFELLPLPKPYRKIERRPSDWCQKKRERLMKLSLFQGIGYVILHKPCLHQSPPDKLATLPLYHRTFVCQSSSYLNLCVFGTSWFESLLVAQQGIEHTRTHTHVGKVSSKNKPLFARGQASIPHSKHKGDHAGGVEWAIRNSKRTTPDQPGVFEHRLSFADLHYTPQC